MKLNYLFSFTRYLNRLFKFYNPSKYPQLEYYYKNKEKILEKRKEYYQKNKDNFKQYYLKKKENK